VLTHGNDFIVTVIFIGEREIFRGHFLRDKNIKLLHSVREEKFNFCTEFIGIENGVMYRMCDWQALNVVFILYVCRYLE